MTKQLDHRKYKIIQEIIKIDDELLLSALEEQIEQNQSTDTDLWNQVMKPMRKTITVEEMVVEQNYKPILAEDFFAKAKELNIEEPLEDLLDQLD